MDDVRALEPLWPLRQRRHAVVACLDDVPALDALRPRLDELRAELVVELACPECGPQAWGPRRVAGRVGTHPARSRLPCVTRIRVPFV